MAKVLVTEGYLSDIAEAIRSKNGEATTYRPGDMAAAIQAIPTGGITPTGTLEITENGTYDVTQYASVNINVSGGGGSVTIVPWATGTDAEIAAMIDAAHAGTIDLQQDGGWAVGDVRTITVDAFTAGGDVSVSQQSIDIVITSFDEYMSCGNVLQFDFKDCLEEGIAFDTIDGSIGYKLSEIKTVTIPALANALPLWLRSRLIEFSVLVGVQPYSSNVETVTGNKLALRSEIEVYESASSSPAGEGVYMPYYSQTNRIKKKGHSGQGFSWWLRSPTQYERRQYCCIGYNGMSTKFGSSNLLGVAPFGCL